MGVTVEDGGDGQAQQRIFEAAGAQERENLRRLALYRGLDGGVVQQGDTMRRAQANQRGLQLERLVYGLVDEALDRLLAPGGERIAPEAAAEAAHAHETHAMHLTGVAVEESDTGIAEDVTHFAGLAGLEIVVAQHGDGGNL